MCNPGVRARHGAVAQIDGRPVLQPASNRVLTPETGHPLKKLPLQKPFAASTTLSTSSNENTIRLDTSVVLASRPVAAPATVEKREGEKPLSPKVAQVNLGPAVAKKKAPKKSSSSHSWSSPFVSREKVTVPGSIAAAQREKATLLQAQRKMKIAHYGRVPGKVVPLSSSPPASTDAGGPDDSNRCCLITSNSDPIYIAYHDEEWGVPVHDDRMLFELLVLAGAQAGLDWTTILRKREEYRAAFAGFEAEVVAGFSEKKMASISAEYGMDLGRVRSVVNNAKCILEVRKEMGSLDGYIWAFINNRPIFTQYSSCRKIPAKTSKSEAISKDMVRRGFRLVGPTVAHSFMQAAGLTVDHLLSCPRRRLLLLQHGGAAVEGGSGLTEAAST
ncbi:hypothetical protein Taro_044677 [Colocasia esculenta]|uniref:DNA-3-methyladenine glycosylase I n=1 Tax=Colocasia esculenta TaxID=4460 RepID=A0A843WV60_COLES|nr:hypothetical protein [Colocasia esculenta]